MKSQTKWGAGFIIFGLSILFLIDFVVEHEGEEVNEDIGIGMAKLFYAGPFILIGLAIILFRGREEKIEQVKEDT